MYIAIKCNEKNFNNLFSNKYIFSSIRCPNFHLCILFAYFYSNYNFQFDEKKVPYTDKFSDIEEIKKFIFVHSLPPVIEFNQETAQKIFGGQIKSHLLLFLSKKEGHFDTFIEGIKPVATDFRGKVNYDT